MNFSVGAKLVLLNISLSAGFAEEPWSISRENAVTRDAIFTRADESPEEVHEIPGFISFYQKYISPLDGPTCHYYPTCSVYTGMSIRKNGLLKGLLMGTDRLIRCHPGQSEYPIDPPVDY